MSEIFSFVGSLLKITLYQIIQFGRQKTEVLDDSLTKFCLRLGSKILLLEVTNRSRPYSVKDVIQLFEQNRILYNRIYFFPVKDTYQKFFYMNCTIVSNLPDCEISSCVGPTLCTCASSSFGNPLHE